MEVFIVLRAIKANFHNDWDTLDYYEGMNCVGVFTTLALAKASTRNTEDWIETRLNDSCLEFKKGWKQVKSKECHFIIKRILTVE
jgi:hypothetical protein